MIVYIAKNRRDGKAYIGKTVRKLQSRIRQHCSAANSGRENGYFHRAINKYGEDAFSWGMLASCKTESELSVAETFYISLYETNDRSKGYNSTTGGEGCEGFRHTKETIQRLSVIKKGVLSGPKNGMYGRKRSERIKKAHSERMSGKNHPNYGKPRSEETKRRIGDGNRGKVITQEQREKASNTLRGRFSGKDNPRYGQPGLVGDLNGMYGKKHTAETRRKISLAKRARDNQRKGKA